MERTLNKEVSQIMSDFLPIVVAAPADARERLRKKNILPQRFFRDLASESVWDDHTGPAIYLWPYDIPYAGSDKFRDEATKRESDVPGLFGMTEEEEKDHQERMLFSRLLSGSIMVHVVFLDNRKTDTTPGVEERNETYAQFCTFHDIIEWSRNLKNVMEMRLLNSKAPSKHILVLIAANQQVVATQEEIKTLNECIGESSEDSIRPFHACYFMDLNLNPGGSKKIIHSKYVWDVQVTRLLLALLLSQEQKDKLPPLYNFAGIKVWRAEDCVFSIDQEESSRILKETLESASQKVMSQVSDQSQKWIMLEQDVTLNKNGLTEPLKPDWGGSKEEKIMSVWRVNAAKRRSVQSWIRMLFYDWSGIPVETLRDSLLSSKHWAGSLEKKKEQRLRWLNEDENKPKDYSKPVSDFFDILKSKPGILTGFVNSLYDKMLSTSKLLKSQNREFWSQIAELENHRVSALKTAEEHSIEFKKAQDHYVGLGPAVMIVVSVTLFLGWMIWQTCSLLGIGIIPILRLSVMVFAGSVVACFIMLRLHNFTGSRAATELVKEYDQADQLMIKRDEIVREMFFEGVMTRERLNLQNVRFRSLQLAQRILSILNTELQPELSSLADDKERLGTELTDTDDTLADKDGVRDVFLEMTRKQVGPLKPDEEKFKPDDIIKPYFSDEDLSNEDTFFGVWNKLSSADTEKAGYYPAKITVFKIRSFVKSFFSQIQEELLKSIDIGHTAGNEDLLGSYIKENIEKKADNKHSGDFFSASLPEYYSNGKNDIRLSYLFFNSQFSESGPKMDGMDGFRIFKSEELAKTTILAMFYQEYSVKFALKVIPGAKTEYGQLTFILADKGKGE